MISDLNGTGLSEKMNKNIHVLRLLTVKDHLRPHRCILYVLCTESTSTSSSDKEKKATAIPTPISQLQEPVHQALCIGKSQLSVHQGAEKRTENSRHVKFE